MDAYSLVVLNLVDKPRPPQMDAKAEDSYYARHTGYPAPQRSFVGSLAIAALAVWWVLVGPPIT